MVWCVGVSGTGQQISRSACRCLPLVCLSAVTVTVCLRVFLPCFLIISSFPTPLPSLSSCHHSCLALWIPGKQEKGREVREPTCLMMVTSLRGTNQPPFLAMTIPCLHVALLGPGEAPGAAALFAEGQSSCKEPLHKEQLHVNTSVEAEACHASAAVTVSAVLWHE